VQLKLLELLGRKDDSILERLNSSVGITMSLEFGDIRRDRGNDSLANWKHTGGTKTR
jgi:hypothetical protein